MITKEQAATAVARMAALRYFPSEAMARAEIAAMLIRMVGRLEQLDWLVIALIDGVDNWPGPRELRAIYCTKYRPLDGIEKWSELPGFRAADSESQHLLEHSRYKELEDDSDKRGRGDLKRITQ